MIVVVVDLCMCRFRVNAETVKETRSRAKAMGLERRGINNHVVP